MKWYSSGYSSAFLFSSSSSIVTFYYLFLCSPFSVLFQSRVHLCFSYFALDNDNTPNHNNNNNKTEKKKKKLRKKHLTQEALHWTKRKKNGKWLWNVNRQMYHINYACYFPFVYFFLFFCVTVHMHT